MRVLITLMHIHPLIPLAQALQAAGHEVAFAGSAEDYPVLEGLGFCCFVAGASFDEAAPAFMPGFMAQPKATRDAYMVREAFVGVLARRKIPQLLDICRTWQPAVVVRDATDFAGCIAAEVLGIPHASVEVGTFLPGAALQRMLAGRLDVLRMECGLAPDPELQMIYRYLHLAFVPPVSKTPPSPGRPRPTRCGPSFLIAPTPTNYRIRWRTCPPSPRCMPHWGWSSAARGSMGARSRYSAPSWTASAGRPST